MVTQHIVRHHHKMSLRRHPTKTHSKLTSWLAGLQGVICTHAALSRVLVNLLHHQSCGPCFPLHCPLRQAVLISSLFYTLNGLLSHRGHMQQLQEFIRAIHQALVRLRQCCAYHRPLLILKACVLQDACLELQQQLLRLQSIDRVPLCACTFPPRSCKITGNSGAQG